MIRKIKVRVWSKPMKRFLTKDEWFFDFDGSLYFWDIIENNLISVREVEYVVQQYTGLLDKNGVEIYEGDIVLDSLYNDKLQSQKDKFVIYHYDAAFRLNVVWGGYGGRTLHSGVEIVGNIFENPELLK